MDIVPAMRRVVSEDGLSAMVGGVKEILEASVADKRQCVALKNIVADKIYQVWREWGIEMTNKEQQTFFESYHKRPESKDMPAISTTYSE